MKAFRELFDHCLSIFDPDPQDPSYTLWIDILFLSLFALNIAFNLYSLQKQIRDYIGDKRQRQDGSTSQYGNGQFIILFIIFLLTVSLGSRMILIIYQIAQHKEIKTNQLYSYLQICPPRLIYQQMQAALIQNVIYFELPYHLFNVVAYIVLMQWVQLWAILATQRGIQEESSSEGGGGIVSNPTDQQQESNQESSQEFKLPQHRLMKKSKLWSLIVSLSEGGTFYMVVVFGIAGISLSILLIDSIFCLIENLTREKNAAVDTVFLVFTYALMLLGVVVTASYAAIYYLIYREFRGLPPAIFKTVFSRMNLFFILMLVIMGSRTVYYIVMHFTFEQKFTDRPPDNIYLIGIYFQEIVFNFVVFYNQHIIVR